jgi:hypothetical protein
MPDKAQQKRRTNRVFKSLHKPLTYLGVERTLFYFVCVGAVGAFNLFNSILAGIAVFIGGFAFGHWVTNSDPAFLRILFDGSRAGRNFALDRQVEPLVMESEISGLPDRHAYMKYENYVTRFSFPYFDMPVIASDFDLRDTPEDKLPYDPRNIGVAKPRFRPHD